MCRRFLKFCIARWITADVNAALSDRIIISSSLISLLLGVNRPQQRLDRIRSGFDKLSLWQSQIPCFGWMIQQQTQFVKSTRSTAEYYSSKTHITGKQYYRPINDWVEALLQTKFQTPSDYLIQLWLAFTALSLLASQMWKVFLPHRGSVGMTDRGGNIRAHPGRQKSVYATGLWATSTGSETQTLFLARIHDKTKTRQFISDLTIKHQFWTVGFTFMRCLLCARLQISSVF